MATDVASSLSSALGLSSGINTAELVSSLTAATYDPKQNAVNTRTTTNNARISALASAKSALSTFSNALTQLLKNSDYNGQPVSNDASIATVSAIAGGVPKGLPAQLEVKQLATAQVLRSAALAGSTAVAGTGTLTLAAGGHDYDIELTAPNNTLADLANAINAAKAGVTASVVTDKSGARLVLKGATGADQAFTLAAGVDADTDLQRFTWDGTTGSLAKSQSAQNAKIEIDQVAMEFASNDISTAIPYLRIDLNKAQPGTLVTLATNQPTSSMEDLVGEFVTAYNNLKSALNSSTASNVDAGTIGLLSSDPGVREMSRRLAAFAGTALADSGPYRTLNDLGVSTNRDGTLSLNSDRLKAALAANPEAVTQMLNPTVPSTGNPGIAGALKKITDYLNAENGPLASSAAIYDKLKASLQSQLDKLGTDRSNFSTQLTKTYTAMQTRLLQFKATQSYLEQQITVWNNKNG